MAQNGPSTGSWSNAMAGPGLFPAVARSSPFTFPVATESSQPGNASVIMGYANPFRWREDRPFDAMQVQRELIFVMPWSTGDFPDQPRFLSLGQVNLTLRSAWDKYTALDRQHAKNPTPESAIAKKYTKRGENYFYDINSAGDVMESKLYGEEYRFDEKRKIFSLLNRMSIMAQFSLAGVKKTSASGSNGITPDRSCAVVQNGPAMVINYWKDAQVGDDLWVVLKKEKDIGYQFVPWCGRGSPTSMDTMYTDIAGFQFSGGKYRVGQVTRGNHLTASEKRRMAVLGSGDNNISLESVKHEAENIPTLDINVSIGDDM